MIDHMVMSFYMNANDNSISTVKFGGWDENGLADPHNGLKIYQTVDLANWALKASKAQFGANMPLLFDTPAPGYRTIQLDFQVPYMYIPQADY